jgi:hypothetical protein
VCADMFKRVMIFRDTLRLRFAAGVRDRLICRTRLPISRWALAAAARACGSVPEDGERLRADKYMWMRIAVLKSCLK